MLAAVRIGAIHIVMFAGFGAQALSDRVQALGSHLIFTTDITYHKSKNVRLKEIVDAFLAGGNMTSICYHRFHAGDLPA